MAGIIYNISIHDCDRIKPDIDCDPNGTASWLSLQYGDHPAHSITFYMPLERADLIAGAIAKAEDEWERRCEQRAAAEKAQFEKEHRLSIPQLV